MYVRLPWGHATTLVEGSDVVVYVRACVRALPGAQVTGSGLPAAFLTTAPPICQRAATPLIRTAASRPVAAAIRFRRVPRCEGVTVPSPGGLGGVVGAGGGRIGEVSR